MRYLKQPEIDEMKRLREDGWKIKALAAKFGVCEATVSSTVNDKRQPRRLLSPSTFSADIMPDENFKDLPDTVLFQHVRIWDFIG
jgi:hypothetical protein